MGIETVLVVFGDIAHSKKIKFLAYSTASDVNGKQDGPSYQAADKGYDRCDFEKPKEEIGVQRLVVQDVGIRDAGEFANPVEQTTRKFGRPLTTSL